MDWEQWERVGGEREISLCSEVFHVPNSQREKQRARKYDKKKRFIPRRNTEVEIKMLAVEFLC